MTHQSPTVQRLRREEAIRAAEAAEAARREKRRAELKKLRLDDSIDALPPAQRSRQAQMEKAKGNEYFQAGDYDDAILYYSRALACESTTSPAAAVLFTNRAQARLKIKSWASAEEDCEAGGWPSCVTRPRARAADPSAASAALLRGRRWRRRR